MSNKTIIRNIFLPVFFITIVMVFLTVYQTGQLTSKHKALISNIAKDFAQYRHSEWQLMTISKYQEILNQKGKHLTQIQLNRKNRYVVDRDNEYKALIGNLEVAKYTLGGKVKFVINQYEAWAKANALKTVGNAPTDKAYQGWESKIILSIQGK